MDLVAKREKVAVNGADEFVEVRGLSAQDCAEILKRYPSLEKVFLGRGISVDELRAMAHDCLGAIIAAGLTKLGDHETETAANALPLELQTSFIEAIGRATLPSGFGPFANRLTTAFGGLHSAPAGKAPDTKSPKASRPSAATETPPSGL